MYTLKIKHVNLPVGVKSDDADSPKTEIINMFIILLARFQLKLTEFSRDQQATFSTPPAPHQTLKIQWNPAFIMRSPQ